LETVHSEVVCRSEWRLSEPCVQQPAHSRGEIAERRLMCQLDDASPAIIYSGTWQTDADVDREFLTASGEIMRGAVQLTASCECRGQAGLLPRHPPPNIQRGEQSSLIAS
jgi:hypothetical protein